MIKTDIDLAPAETEEIERCAQEDAKESGLEIDFVKVWLDSDELCMKTYFKSNIRRIRWIAGYLSTVGRFNDGKQAELANRRVHDYDVDDLQYGFR